eukprot:gene18619-20496_t
MTSLRHCLKKSARKRRSTSNADDVTETITVGDLDLNVTKAKCHTVEKRLFYLAKVLNGFIKGISSYENLTKEVEIAERLRGNFTQNIDANIQVNDVCGNNSAGNHSKPENCSTEWLAGLYANVTGGVRTNASLSWRTMRAQIIIDLEIFTKSQNFTSCAGVRDCVNSSIDTISEKVEFESSHLAKLCREAIPLWRASFQRILNNDSNTLNQTKEHTKIISNSFSASMPSAIYCGSPPIIISDLPSKAIVANDRSGYLNFSLVPSLHQATFVWKKDNVILATSAKQSLLLTSVDSSTAGYYNCEVQNKFGKIITKTAHVVYHVKPSITTRPNDVKVTLKSPSPLLTLTCNASGTPMPTISWLHAPFSNISQHTLLHVTGNVLSLNSTRSNQSGFYFCKASNSQGYVHSRPARVHVLQSTIAEMAVKLSFNVYSQQDTENKTPVPLALSLVDRTKLAIVLANYMNISTSRINKIHYTRSSDQSAMLSFNLKTQQLAHLLAATSDWTSISEDIVLARKGLLIMSIWLHHVFSNVSNQLPVGNTNLTVNAETLDVDPMTANCPIGYSLHSNGFICEICPAGSEYVPAIGCNSCNINSYQSEQGQRSCSKCPEKFLTSSVGSVHFGDCFKSEMTTSPAAPSSYTVIQRTTSSPESEAPVANEAISTSKSPTTTTAAIPKAKKKTNNAIVGIVIGTIFGIAIIIIIIVVIITNRPDAKVWP